MKSYFLIFFISLSSISAFAQQQSDAGAVPPSTINPNPLVTLASKFFEHDFFNVFAYGSGVYDHYSPPSGITDFNNNSVGFSVGGGINAFHSFRDGSISASYSGGYSDYRSGSLTSGTNQNLSLGYNKRLTRRWTLSASAGGGIFLYGGTFFSSQPNPNNAVVTNPFTPETRFLSTGIGLTYQQTRRLSYSFGGNFFLQRYNGVGGIGATGGAGSVGVNYRLTPRTTVSGSYSHNYFVYQNNVGHANVDGISLTATHQFNNHWQMSVFVGANRSHAMGVYDIPLTVLTDQGAFPIFVLGHYDQVSFVPSFGASVSHNYRRSLLSFSAGQGISGAGNGVYLASRNIYINGVYSYNLRGSSLSVAGSYYRLSSVANAVSSSYSTGTLSASYSRNLVRYLGAFLRYDYTRYGSLNTFSGATDNRLSFGVNFSSRSIPMTLF